MDTKLIEKLRIAFKYGIKATENHEEESDDAYFNRAISVINRLYSSAHKPEYTNEKSIQNHILIKNEA